jgi:hypothetical protein
MLHMKQQQQLILFAGPVLEVSPYLLPITIVEGISL